MSTSASSRRASLAAAALVLVAAVTMTACGELRASDAAAGASPEALPATSPATSPGTSPFTSPGTSPGTSAPTGGTGASPYVEPGAGDGAPHYNENNAYRRAGEMTPAHAKDAEREAARIRPVLQRLWEQRTWDPASVRAALLRLGYEEERVTRDGKRLGGTLTVREMFQRFEHDHYVTPEGALVGLRVHDDACVTAFVQKSNYEVQANGPYPETGCFEPPYGH
ncbi:hypothetical protein [Streptomyces sp. NPDC098781]|uniref:hypothetical protein n=1 Tax=Streptomyces sp. NPDC098781 TaxID=3366097 RepID=UPI00381559A6